MKPTLSEIDQREERLRQDIAAREKDIEQDRKLLEAYELVKADMSGRSNGESRPEVVQSLPKSYFAPRPIPAPGSYGRTTILVRDELSRTNGSFTIKDIYDRLKKFVPDIALASVTTVFWALRDKEEIKVKRPGSGRQPIIFEKTEKFAAET